MKLGTTLNRGVDFNTEAARIVELERAGLDAVWVAESYSTMRSARSAISPR